MSDDDPHRTTIRIPLPLLADLDQDHIDSMRRGETSRASSRNDHIIYLLGIMVQQRKKAEPSAPTSQKKRRGRE